MRILFIQKEGGIFGAENYQLNIIPALVAKGIEIEFLRLYTNYQLGRDSEFVKRLQGLGIVVHQVNIGRVPGISDFGKVRSMIKNGRFDIIHSHLIHADLYAALVKLSGVKGPRYVSSKHGYDNQFAAKYGFDASKQTATTYFRISRWAERRMDASFTISKGLHRFFMEIGLSTPEKMRMIYYGFNFPEVIEEPGDIDTYRIAPQQLCITGRLVGFKGHRWAFDALKHLKENYSDVKLVVIGTGNEEPQLREYVTAAGLENQVVFLGYRKDVSKWMHYSDVVLVPSRSEGFGVVFLEAFNARTPVVAFDVPASNELIIPGKTGVLVPPYDTKTMAEGIAGLLNSQSLRQSLSAEAFNRYKQTFTLDNMVNNTLQFYQEVMHA